MIKKSLLKISGKPILPPFEATVKSHGQQFEVNKLNLYSNTTSCTSPIVYLPTTPSGVVDDDEVYFAQAFCCMSYPWCLYVCGSGTMELPGFGTAQTYWPWGCAFRAGMLKWDSAYSKWRAVLYT